MGSKIKGHKASQWLFDPSGVVMGETDVFQDPLMKYDPDKAVTKYTPGQYYESPEYKAALSKLGKSMTESDQKTTSLADSMRSNYDKITDPNYSALSEEQMQALYNQGVETLRPQFKEMESNLGSRMANQGLAGSGISGAEWSGLGKKQSEALSDVWNNVFNKNIDMTQQNKQSALSSTGTIANMYQQPVANASALMSAYGMDQSAKNAWNQWIGEMQYGIAKDKAQAYKDEYQRQLDQMNQDHAIKANFAGQLLGKG